MGPDLSKSYEQTYLYFRRKRGEKEIKGFKYLEKLILSSIIKVL